MESCDKMMAIVLDHDKATLDCAKQKLFHKDHTQLLSTAPLECHPKHPKRDHWSFPPTTDFRRNHPLVPLLLSNNIAAMFFTLFQFFFINLTDLFLFLSIFFSFH